MNGHPDARDLDPRSVARRYEAAGLHGGARLTRVSGPEEAFRLSRLALDASEQRLSELVASEVDVVHAIGGYLAASGGKRLRPLLVALGAGAVGFEGDLPGLMCVGELIHLGSLLHDDVVDDATLRRGRPAAHTVYGNPAVILSGDFCLARAVLLAAETGGLGATHALGAAVTAMAEGEVLQLQHAGDLGTSVEAYISVVDRKSAALIAWCASAGARAVGNAAAAAALERYGRGVGVAFQITDDVLDYAGGAGKPVGTDLRERKLTLPLVHALRRVPGLRARLEAGVPTPDELPGLVAAVHECGALEAARDEARARVEAALGALDELPGSPERDALAGLGRYLVERDT
jgi:octaprenyl-diphosphate synthase